MIFGEVLSCNTNREDVVFTQRNLFSQFFWLEQVNIAVAQRLVWGVAELAELEL